MCSSGTETESPWQQSLPDQEGEWLWVTQWSCGCVLASGIAWVTPHELCDATGMIHLPCGMWLSWEGKTHTVNAVTAWRKIVLPPQEWCEA